MIMFSHACEHTCSEYSMAIVILTRCAHANNNYTPWYAFSHVLTATYHLTVVSYCIPVQQ